MHEPRRRAILIGSQSPNGAYLPGVEGDIDRMKSYLKSPNGGVWDDQEINTLQNPSSQFVLYTIKNTIADYLLIYFSGHGYTRNQVERMIALANGDIRDIQLINQSPRQLIIIDACRTRERPAAIGCIPWPEEKWDYFSGYSAARAFFDQCITDSPFGKLIVHATNDDNFAYENHKRRGGEFTLALLDSVLSYQQSQQSGTLSIETTVQRAAELLKSRNIDQQPCTYREGYFKVPFGIISSEFISVQNKKRKELTGAEGNSTNSFWTLLGLSLLVYAASR